MESCAICGANWPELVSGQASRPFSWHPVLGVLCRWHTLLYERLPVMRPEAK